MPVRPRTSRPWTSRLFYPLAILFVLVLCAAGYTLKYGRLDLPFFPNPVFAFEEEKSPVKQGSVLVLVTPRAIPAYTEITREHFMVEGTVQSLPIPQDLAKEKGLFVASPEGIVALLGRVLKRDKAANFAFKETDFLPKGTRPGPSAGIPAGKRGLWVEAESVVGLADLRLGDRIDLLAAQEVPAPKSTVTNALPLGDGEPIVQQLAKITAASAQPTARTWVVARDATVVLPMRIRQVPTTNSSVLRGTKVQTRPVQEVFLGLAPDEVAKLSQALAMGASIRCAPRSSQPGAVGEIQMPDLEAPDPGKTVRELMKRLGGDDGFPLSRVQVIHGDRKEWVTVKRAPSEKEGK